jgi:hypothetical protein
VALPLPMYVRIGFFIGVTTHRKPAPADSWVIATQGCQIFLGTAYQNGKIHQRIIKCTKETQQYTNVPKNIPNGHKMYQNSLRQALQKYKKWHFRFENLPSGNPAHFQCSRFQSFHRKNGSDSLFL